jgi:hypothetical protein
VTDRAEPGTRLVEELRLLLEAVSERAGPWLDRAVPSETAAGSSCGWCPVCAVVALLRGEPNALAGRGLEHAADLVALLRAVLADRWEPGVPHMPGFTPAGEPRAHGERPKAQPIPVRRTASGEDGAEDGGLAQERKRPSKQ